VTATPNIAALRHVELVAGLPDATIDVRLIPDADKSKPTRKLRGTLHDLWSEIDAAQADGYGVFLVVNDGGNADADTTEIRAAFIDADGTSLAAVAWHLAPDFLVQRSDAHWHAYWRTVDLPVPQFRDVQKRLAAHYGTDPAVCNPSRVMRLAGTRHLKRGAPGEPVKLVDLTAGAEPWELGHTLADLLAGLPNATALASKPSEPSSLVGTPLSPKQLAAMLACLDPDCPRDEWRDIAAALHAAPCTDPDFDKCALFVAWSRGEVRNV